MKYLIMLSLLILSCYANEADRIKTAQKFEQNGFTKEDISIYSVLDYDGQTLTDKKLNECKLFKKYKVDYHDFTQYFINLYSNQYYEKSIEDSIQLYIEAKKSKMTKDEFREWFFFYREEDVRFFKHYNAMLTWRKLGYSLEEAKKWFISFDVNDIEKIDKYKKAGLNVEISKKAVKDNLSLHQAQTMQIKLQDTAKRFKKKLLVIIKKECNDKVYEYTL